VGKTTTTINLGAALAHKGCRVLIIDMDPQGHLSQGLGIREEYLEGSPNLYELLVGDVKGSLKDITLKAREDNLTIAPSNIRLFLAEQRLTIQRGREFRLRRLIEGVEDEFDWALIDCPPSLGILTDNAIYASRRVLVPIQAEDTSIRALEILLDQIQSLQEALKAKVKLVGILPTMVENTRLAKGVLTSLRENLPMTFPFEIRKRVKLKEAWASGKSIFSYDPKGDLIPVYLRLAEEVMKRVK